jgi:MFS family permease
MTGNPLSSVIGGPISGFILDTLDGSMGLRGWQWLFIIEGVPSVLVGLWALGHLTDKPERLPGSSLTSASPSRQRSIMSERAVKRSAIISWEKLSQIPAFLV